MTDRLESIRTLICKRNQIYEQMKEVRTLQFCKEVYELIRQLGRESNSITDQIYSFENCEYLIGLGHGYEFKVDSVVYKISRSSSVFGFVNVNKVREFKKEHSIFKRV